MADIVVCPIADVAPGAAIRVDVEGLRLAVVHIDDAWYVLGDRCSHADASLAEGMVWCEEREIECPKHGSTFALATGEPQSLPATRPVPVYECRVEEGHLVVTLP